MPRLLSSLLKRVGLEVYTLLLSITLIKAIDGSSNPLFLKITGRWAEYQNAHFWCWSLTRRSLWPLKMKRWACGKPLTHLTRRSRALVVDSKETTWMVHRCMELYQLKNLVNIIEEEIIIPRATCPSIISQAKKIVKARWPCNDLS